MAAAMGTEFADVLKKVGSLPTMTSIVRSAEEKCKEEMKVVFKVNRTLLLSLPLSPPFVRSI